MGFPFFAPAFDPEAHIVIHAGHADAEEALRRQQEEISFPVPFDWLRAKIEFAPIAPGAEIEVGGIARPRDRAAPFARQLRLPLHRRQRQGRRVQHRQRAQGRPDGRAKPRSSTSSATPTW